MLIRIILKSGKEFTVKCESLKLKYDGLGNPTGYEFNGIVENKPVYLNFDEVAAIVRVLSNESGAAV